MQGQGQLRWWAERGFWGNPYDTRPLGNDRNAGELLVGREKIQSDLRAHLQASTAHATLAGPYGGGKTSVVRCLINEMSRNSQLFSSGQLFLPVAAPISPNKQEDPRRFAERCLLELGTALVSGAQAIEAAGGQVGRRLHALGDFVGKPILVSGSMGANVFGTGATGAKAIAPNTGFGFQVSGLEQLVREALKEAFPADELGAVVACIDDVELCGESEQVLQFLSDIREPLLTLPGVKWIILGADEVLEGVGDHPRLAGVVSGLRGLPLLPESSIAGVVEKRIELYHAGFDVVVPVSGEAFSRIYERSGRHLRSALSHSLEFSVYADNRGILDSDLLVKSEQEDEQGQWLRRDVPPEFIDQFLNGLSLGAWDGLAKIGGAAAAVLADLAAAEAVEAEILIQGDASRQAALTRMNDRSFVAGTVPGGPPVGLIRLTGSGHLAVDGARLAGQLP